METQKVIILGTCIESLNSDGTKIYGLSIVENGQVFILTAKKILEKFGYLITVLGVTSDELYDRYKEVKEMDSKQALNLSRVEEWEMC